ncbi:hypothetical protein QRQ56_30610 [Bradyrhizobium sp. U531]|uniref:hypothetical protein n=1 Tax=Bradyrhizobium sp. U531 TaxID=3053458 RepID=UPI003F441B01
MGKSRARIKHAKTFQERLIEEAAKFREVAEQLAPGTERDLLMKRVHQAEQAAQIDNWLTKPNAGTPASIGNMLRTGASR